MSSPHPLCEPKENFYIQRPSDPLWYFCRECPSAWIVGVVIAIPVLLILTCRHQVLCSRGSRTLKYSLSVVATALIPYLQFCAWFLVVGRMWSNAFPRLRHSWNTPWMLVMRTVGLDFTAFGDWAVGLWGSGTEFSTQCAFPLDTTERYLTNTNQSVPWDLNTWQYARSSTNLDRFGPYVESDTLFVVIPESLCRAMLHISLIIFTVGLCYCVWVRYQWEQTNERSARRRRRRANRLRAAQRNQEATVHADDVKDSSSDPAAATATDATNCCTCTPRATSCVSMLGNFCLHYMWWSATPLSLFLVALSSTSGSAVAGLSTVFPFLGVFCGFIMLPNLKARSVRSRHRAPAVIRAVAHGESESDDDDSERSSIVLPPPEDTGAEYEYGGEGVDMYYDEEDHAPENGDVYMSPSDTGDHVSEDSIVLVDTRTPPPPPPPLIPSLQSATHVHSIEMDEMTSELSSSADAKSAPDSPLTQRPQDVSLLSETGPVAEENTTMPDNILLDPGLRDIYAGTDPMLHITQRNVYTRMLGPLWVCESGGQQGKWLAFRARYSLGGVASWLHAVSRHMLFALASLPFLLILSMDQIFVIVGGALFLVGGGLLLLSAVTMQRCLVAKRENRNLCSPGATYIHFRKRPDAVSEMAKIAQVKLPRAHFGMMRGHVFERYFSVHVHSGIALMVFVVLVCAAQYLSLEDDPSHSIAAYVLGALCITVFVWFACVVWGVISLCYAYTALHVTVSVNSTRIRVHRVSFNPPPIPSASNDNSGGSRFSHRETSGMSWCARLWTCRCISARRPMCDFYGIARRRTQAAVEAIRVLDAVLYNRTMPADQSTELYTLRIRECSDLEIGSLYGSGAVSTGSCGSPIWDSLKWKVPYTCDWLNKMVVDTRRTQSIINNDAKCADTKSSGASSVRGGGPLHVVLDSDSEDDVLLDTALPSSRTGRVAESMVLGDQLFTPRAMWAGEN